MRAQHPASTPSLALVLLLLAPTPLLGCGGDDDAAGVDAGPVAVDSGPPTGDAAPPPADGGGGTDAGGRTDAGPPPPCMPDPTLERGDPIATPAGEWTFVEFPESRCMNGSSTGIGVSLNPDSDSVVIYLEGGGACFDVWTCGSVAHSGGFNAATFASIASGGGNRGIFDRTNASNPVADWNFVFVPYCTGDVHAGNNPMGPSGRMHVGYANVGEYLKRLVPTFEGSGKVLLTGSSAGGFGAAWNYHRTQQAFGCTPVYLLDDAGPPLSDAYMKPCLQGLWRDLWNLNATTPPECTDCIGSDGGGISNYLSFIAQRYPERRLGLLSTMADRTIRGFFGYGYSPSCTTPAGMPSAEFEAGLLELRDEITAPYDNFATYYVEGTAHTFLGRQLSTVDENGTNLGDWIGQMISDDPAWTDVGP